MKKKSYIVPLRYTLFSLFITIAFLSSCLFFFKHFFDTSYVAILENNSRKSLSNIKELSLNVTSNTSIEDIAEILFENHFIGNKILFILQSRLDAENPLKEGTYILNNTMNNSSIISLLTENPADAVADIKLTIPEGFTLLQIANKLEDLNIVSKEDFLKAANERTYDYKFLENLPNDLPNKLEGYLFPDTYFISPNASSEDIIIKMLNRFEEITSKYTHNSSFSLHDVITIASIIEEESRLFEERPRIAGVIYNRLEADMKLQMCSTIQYALGNHKQVLSLDDLAIESPYNTYLNNGLPISPICSPGEESIKAAFMPESHEYFYFVLNDVLQGSHSFSTTAAEHAYYKAKYKDIVQQNFME